MRAVVFAYTTSAYRCLRVLLRARRRGAAGRHPRDHPGENDLVRARRRHRRASTACRSSRRRPARTRRCSTRSPRRGPTSSSRSTTGTMLPATMLDARAARRVQHARLAAAAVPRPRAGQLGGAARRDARPARRCTRWSTSPTPARIVDQQAVPILPDDTARAGVRQGHRRRRAGALAQRCRRSSPASVRVRPNDVAAGSYFGGRTPEDGRIDWTPPAQRASTT